MDSLPRIFVQIASYRDPECQWTVKDLFEKATHPERIFVGLCWQYDEEHDQHCFAVPYPRPENIREMRIDWRKAEGVCWARYQTQLLYGGEEYTLQIDSHMRFVQGWDELMIAELAACESEKPVLSCTIARYTPPNQLEENPMPSVLRTGLFDAWGNIRNRGAILINKPQKPLNAAFVSAGFIFSRGEMITEVPYDPYLYFDQEEISYAMRLYTHGWDIFSAREAFVYHYYISVDNIPRPLHWGDMAREKMDEWYKMLRERGSKRFDHITGHSISEDPEIIKELDIFGYGGVRTQDDYERYSGIDFRQKKLSERALRAWFIQDIGKCMDRQLYVPELDDAQEKEKHKSSLVAFDDPLNHPEMPMPQARIFVAIASYRDPECQWTIKDLFEKAAHPERIYAGICWQFDREEDKHCFVVPPPFPSQVRRRDFHYSQAQGVNWARAQAMEMWVGEEYVLTIDSHLRFEPGWDNKLIDMLSRCGQPKSVISSFLPNYDPPNRLQRAPGRIPHIRLNALAQPVESGVTHLTLDFISQESERGRMLCPSPFMVASFMFMRISAMREVPIDPYIFFYGDEITYSTRLWTHGYNIYQPDDYVAYHHWFKPMVAGADYKQFENPRNQRTRERVRHVAGIEISDNPEVLAEIDQYGHGTERTLESFWHFAGIDIERWQASERAFKGDWHLPLPTEVAAPAYAEPAQPQPQQTLVPARMKVAIHHAQAGLAQLSEHTGGMVMYDHFLPQDIFNKLLSICMKQQFAPAGPVAPWHGTMEEGMPLRAPQPLIYRTDSARAEGVTFYPSASVFDVVVDYVVVAAPKLEAIIGKRGVDWLQFDVSTWLVPEGSAFSLRQRMSEKVVGGFVCMMIPQWSWQQGGLLLVNDMSGQDFASPISYRQQATGNSAQTMDARGTARCLFPTPNRMVFFGRDAQPVFTRIQRAGQVPFLILTGLFTK